MLRDKYYYKSQIYDIVKLLVTFLVVIGHCTKMYSSQGIITPLCKSQSLEQITNFIYSFHMPVFMCVSGCVYGLCKFELNKYTDKKNLLPIKLKDYYCLTYL